MKKTLTVNLGGTVFNIDEDAYELLEKYLSNLRIHFSKEEGAAEIMNDFEQRISELFNDRVRLGYQVITINEVEEVIKRMGKPEEIFEMTEEETGEKQQEQDSEKKTYTEDATSQNGKKRLMRDIDNKIIGGVASGIAAYLGWDVTMIRLAFIVLLFVPYLHGIVLVYLLLWLVIPAAKTATEKLEMHGENVTVENIGKTVTNGFNKATNAVDDFITDKQENGFSGSSATQTAEGSKQSQTQPSVLHNIADVFVSVFGFLLKFIAAIAAIILVPVLLLVVFVLVMVTIGLLGGGAGFLYHISPFGFDLANGMPLPFMIMGCISFILLIGIPVFGLIYAICVQFLHARPMSSGVKWTLTILWVIMLIIDIVYFTQTGIMDNWENYWNNLDSWNNSWSSLSLLF
jgi:phage shock protein PspC (stress-responsive transcriptional regulator)